VTKNLLVISLITEKYVGLCQDKQEDNMGKEFNPFMAEAIKLATENVRSGNGGPFAAVIVKDNKIIASAVNEVTSTNDPTAHAEISAIRNACKKLNSFQLEDCDIYCSCEPCPMCLGAIYWARPKNIYYGNTISDAAGIGFDDTFIYNEIGTPVELRKINMKQLMNKEAKESFIEWENKTDKIGY